MVPSLYAKINTHIFYQFQLREAAKVPIVTFKIWNALFKKGHYIPKDPMDHLQDLDEKLLYTLMYLFKVLYTEIYWANPAGIKVSNSH